MRSGECDDNVFGPTARVERWDCNSNNKKTRRDSASWQVG